ncbi:MAG: hypothetical protein Q8Q28_04295 [Pseudomonadota bacterium]|nr:hypothetical protein [Pseudomonadota bacterium]
MKASEMMACWAGEFIALNDDPQGKQGRLKFAVVAWNLACQPKKARAQKAAGFLARLREVNPTGDHQAMQHDLELLIKFKLRMFPDDRRQFLEARLEMTEQGKDAITVVFVPQK